MEKEKVKKVLEVVITVLAALVGALFGSCNRGVIREAIGINDSSVVYNARVKVVNVEAKCQKCGNVFLLTPQNSRRVSSNKY